MDKAAKKLRKKQVRIRDNGTIVDEVRGMMATIPSVPEIRDMDPRERADLAREVELEMREIQRQPD